MYDEETGWYYLQSRYYIPSLCRFLSPDSIDYANPTTIGGLNLYSYCNNDPVNYCDPSGNSAILIGLIIGAIIGACVGFGAAAYIDYKDDGEVFNGSVKWYDYLGASLIGGIAGAGIGAGLGAFAGMSFSATIPTFGLINAGGGALTLATTGTMTLTVNGAQVLTGVAVSGALVLLSYNGGWPGDDPTKAPDGFKWRGKGSLGSSQENWYNPDTGEILHPDLNHPDPIGPHWDFRDVLRKWWRIFRNGKRFPKI